MTIFDSPYLSIKVDNELQAIIEEWKLDFTTTVAGENFRKPMMLIISAIKEQKITRWFCDNTEQKVLESEDQFWLDNVFYKELIKQGLKVAVLVNAKNILGNDTAKNRLQHFKRDLVIEIFNKNALAKDWLKKTII